MAMNLAVANPPKQAKNDRLECKVTRDCAAVKRHSQASQAGVAKLHNHAICVGMARPGTVGRKSQVLPC
ncbi:hypothetical protein E2562_030726 [Oryza meyeriana var. granulata]|uniref:Uncharacterized protein n=1 Tax=Oryza meyeriana var. granulata TaxID=110450 RepID=A0A6G1E545_9ORYZ|nr:hypothetical protein E2562_030726 [Oryza meyeriana var. granulata]